ncbi:hypothetical protein RhiirC2_860813 [Rhizophagus irregularis]|uniref:Uncharacterized protein n=1 Tax=Rhizophagus irregularis TaxID=588596 RepID=A0A2N1NYY5_9GLOM|nr:hypothetical protein RhiirC2_860813 [Rhizophagus irregularis]
MKQIILSCIKKKLLIFLINRNFNFFELYCGVVAFKMNMLMNVSKKELKICIVKDNRKDIIKTVQAYYTSFMCGCKFFQAVHGISDKEIACALYRQDVLRESCKYPRVLDKAGGFLYERWGDAPVHTIALALFLEKNQIHFF